MRIKWLAKLLLRALTPPARGPDFIIGDRYMLRWWVIPRNRYFNIYLHHILHSDDDRALHDHPWWSLSLCLSGQVLEYRKGMELRYVSAGDVVLRSARAAHRLELRDKADCWTLFVTGPVIRNWGFHCPQGWRRWQDYTKPGEYGQIGKGCE